jgi:hypothetical protein
MAYDERPSRTRPYPLDALVVGGNEVYVVVALPGDDVGALLRDGPDTPERVPLRVCRGILDEGIVVLGPTDPEHDPLLSDLVRDGDVENA